MSSFSFTKNQTVSVWEPKGCRELRGGPSSSEKRGGEYEDLLPEEQLVVLQPMGSRALCRRPNGQTLLVHKNHVDPNQSYSAARIAKRAKKEAVATLHPMPKKPSIAMAAEAEAEVDEAAIDAIDAAIAAALAD